MSPTYENCDTVTILFTEDRAHLRVLEQTTTLLRTYDDINPDIVTVGTLDEMQHAASAEILGAQEDIIRGARQREFCPLPLLEPMSTMSIAGVKFDPITRLNARVDAIARARKGSAAMPMPGPGPPAMRRTLIIKERGSGITPPRTHLGERDAPKGNHHDGEERASVARSDAR